MPFDAATQNDPAALYMERRRRAWDEVWSKIPARKFSLEDWSCGTRACAVGWLGYRQHDGWHLRLDACSDLYPSRDIDEPWSDIQTYFGLSKAYAYLCFGADCYGDFIERYGQHKPTLSDVHRVLMAAPVTVPDLAVTDGVT